MAADLKAIYSAPSVEAAETALETCEAMNRDRFPQIARSWRSCRVNIIRSLAYPPEIPKVIYTTNAIESMQAQLLKVTRKHGAFPTAGAVIAERPEEKRALPPMPGGGGMGDMY